MTTTIQEKIEYLRKKMFKEELDDRRIDFTPQPKEEIIMTDIDTEEAVLPTKLEENEEDFTDKEDKKEPKDYLVEMKPKETHETSTNEDLRNKRKKSFFVSGEDYEALERELEAEKKRLADVEQKFREIKKILS